MDYVFNLYLLQSHAISHSAKWLRNFGTQSSFTFSCGIKGSKVKIMRPEAGATGRVSLSEILIYPGVQRPACLANDIDPWLERCKHEDSKRFPGRALTLSRESLSTPRPIPTWPKTWRRPFHPIAVQKVQRRVPRLG